MYEFWVHETPTGNYLILPSDDMITSEKVLNKLPFSQLDIESQYIPIEDGWIVEHISGYNASQALGIIFQSLADELNESLSYGLVKCGETEPDEMIEIKPEVELDEEY